jgi:hypothetical protein
MMLKHDKSLSSHQFSEYDATKDRKEKDPLLDNSEKSDNDNDDDERS